METIKKFFQKKIVKITEGIIIALASAGLILGGVTLAEVEKLPVVTLGVITAIEAVVTLIQGFTAKA